jgi:SHS2 domain-containing protein
MPYKLFDHTADLGIEVEESSLEGIYNSAAEALFSILSDLSAIETKKTLLRRVKGLDREDLLINFLRDLLNLWNRNRFLVRSCEVLEIAPQNLTARLSGEFYNPLIHRIKREIKAVTYHQVSLVHTKRGWKGKFVFDV